LAWVVLLAEPALGGPVGELAGTLSATFGLPGLIVIVFTVIFPALLAGSAAALAAALRGMHSRSRGSASGAVPP